MPINLRENKIDKFDSGDKFFKGFDKTLSKKRDNWEGDGVQFERVEQRNVPKQHQVQNAQNQSQVQYIESEKWVRKAPKDPLPVEKLDYQESRKYPKETSRYLQENIDDVLVHWRGPDFEHYPRSRGWYVGILLTLAFIVLYALLTDSIIMAIVFILIGIVGYLQLSRPPKVIDFAIMYNGILVGDELFDYDSMKSFWIFYEPPHTRIISFHMKGGLRPYLHIPLHQIDPVIVHENLTQFIPEEKQEQNLVDIMERLLHM
ncbi:MAG: hypothetical protein ABFQ53_00650 [Patescibacteria group bacterium]